jgi:hypothetical protein
MSDSKIARIAKGKRPIYFEDPATDKLMAMLLTVIGELSVCRDRIDALERLLDQKDVVSRAEVDGFIPGDDADTERDTARAAYIARIMRVVTRELQRPGDDGATESFSTVLESMLDPAEE